MASVSSGGDPAKRLAPTAYPQEGDLPPPPPPAMPTVPTAAKALNARSFGALADDPFIGALAQTMQEHTQQQAANAGDHADGICKAIVPGTMAYEVIVGETITGKEVPMLERGMQAGLMVLPVVPGAAGAVANKITSRTSKGAPAVKAATKVESQAVKNVAPTGVTVRSAKEVTPFSNKNHLTDIKIDGTKYPESAKHLKDSGYNGKTVTIDRAGAAQRRKDALSGVKSKPKLDRDEMPPAVFQEGSQSVRHIPSADNRGAGASIGNQLRGIPNAVKVRLIVEP